MIQARTQRIIRALGKDEPQEEPLESREDLERELAQLELFCLMNGLSLELFDQWKLSRTNRTRSHDPRTTD